MDTINNLSDFSSIKKKNNIFNFYALAIAGSFGHVFFGLYWRYIDPYAFELPVLRLIGIVICIALFFVAKNYDKLLLKNGRLVNIWWLFAVLYNLPFFFSVNILVSDSHYIWLTSSVVMIFVVVMFCSGALFSLLMLALGVFLAVIFCNSHGYEYALMHPALITVLPVYLLAFVAAYIFSISNVMGLSFYMVREFQFALTKKSLKSLAASIAHEIRNPLNSINLIGKQMDGVFLQEKKICKNLNSEKSLRQYEKNREELLKMRSQISESIGLANSIIDIILSDLSDKKAAEDEYEILNPIKVIPQIIDKYGYQSESEKCRVTIDEKLQSLINEGDNSNLFRAVEDRFKFIMYNLLKNSLYYLKEYQGSMVTIGIELKKVGCKEFLSIFVHDTGPGIKQSAMEKLFDDFYTSGKSDGTGIGLAFCKRNMKMFDGDIICESKYGDGQSGWTKFSLLFPKIDKEGLDAAVTIKKNNIVEVDKKLLKEKRVIIADDDPVNLMMMAQYLERFFLKVDKVKDGQELLEKFKNYQYDIVISDINMSKMTGVEVAYKIREYEKKNNLNKVPIIAFTGDVEQEKVDNYIKAGIDDYFKKGDDLEGLIRVLLRLS